ncbi:MAG: STAS domain-containing protein [Desulfuromonadaceae bacterium]|nr:STAS domain-containing protein [Desulfuromonadaceae bacterium]
MKIFTKGSVAHLHGDLNLSGVTNTIINSLAISLQKLGSASEKTFHIDCGKVRSADYSGLQLLYVWMQCAKFRGVEASLVNLPDRLQLDIEMMGLGDCFVGTAVHQ